jgi:hypothetical protein
VNFWTFLDRNIVPVVVLAFIVMMFGGLTVTEVAKAHATPFPACIDGGAR